jgi:hypothetical protein
MTPNETFAEELQTALLEAGCEVPLAVCLEAAGAHWEQGKAACMEVLVAAGVPMTVKGGGRWGASAIKCDSFYVNGITILMG